MAVEHQGDMQWPPQDMVDQVTAMPTKALVGEIVPLLDMSPARLDTWGKGALLLLSHLTSGPAPEWSRDSTDQESRVTLGHRDALMQVLVERIAEIWAPSPAQERKEA
jgi:hypothetical protein